MGSLRPSNVFFFNLNYFPQRFFLKSFFSKILKASPLTNPFFNIWRVTRGEMCVQEGSRSFKMGLCIKYRFFLESCALICIQPCLKTQSQCQMFRP